MALGVEAVIMRQLLLRSLARREAGKSTGCDFCVFLPREITVMQSLGFLYYLSESQQLLEAHRAQKAKPASQQYCSSRQRLAR